MAKQLYLVYIEPTRLFVYVSSTSAVLQLPIPWEIMHDLEVVDKEKFTLLMQNFIKTNAIIPGSVAFALAPQLTFEADFPLQLPSDQQKLQLQKFLDAIPFQDVASQFEKFNTINKAVASNKNLIELLRNIFEGEKFTVTHAIPVSILQLLAPELQTNLDMGVILNKIDLVHQFNLFSQTTAIAQQTTSQKQEFPPLKNKRTLFLLVVFGGLMIVLIIMVFAMLLPQSQQPKPLPPPPVHLPNAPVKTQVATPSATESPASPTIVAH